MQKSKDGKERKQEDGKGQLTTDPRQWKVADTGGTVDEDGDTSG